MKKIKNHHNIGTSGRKSNVLFKVVFSGMNACPQSWLPWIDDLVNSTHVSAAMHKNSL